LRIVPSHAHQRHTKAAQNEVVAVTEGPEASDPKRSAMDEEFIRQLDDILNQYEVLGPKNQDREPINQNSNELLSFIARASAAIERMTRPQSAYQRHLNNINELGGRLGYRIPLLYGLIDALRRDIVSGYMKSQEEIIHGELFTDFLEMVRHLLDEGFKDAAAVIAGSALEAHLRQLCQKHGIETTIEKDTAVAAKKADRLNADLVKAEVYSKLDAKHVTAWLDLRNKAAHGRYSEYVKSQVSGLIDGIRDFIARNPA
jgi:hypothetical protein